MLSELRNLPEVFKSSIPSLTGEGIFIHITKHVACHIYI
ncbi:hypothetical protein EcSMS35_1622 [Escherichia coli SMS-3-5]|uniref:Uncharacterized protein n=1 Tax=Escherichia coli (strain SMS-3-5 / SECEC) TaxID=439855 RepID=B1LEV8_ECOSM|nr:hypothetical protein EcSMS35_1622 [Escherichia coli SMS-3-5]AKK48240.1 hypothetical protein PPECC33_01684 [Escherichia coli PCN033]EII85527.1 hypothetical protein EC3003_1689 [Escherichia coli 3003]EKI28546.1 hypothetical protein ECARS42123_1931 [Escherichia coli ARS4.2123]EYE04529.1 hypothetical protein AC80_1989 [Escherichia coli 1-110-08_S4_C1]KDW75855.1 hypothetical protein AB14_0870 [Escherichia coli 1-392-07_S1_C1]KDW83391.1 hypothetical protein AB42_1766 [Escherichia coli 1-392-07_S